VYRVVPEEGCQWYLSGVVAVEARRDRPTDRQTGHFFSRPLQLPPPQQCGSLPFCLTPSLLLPPGHDMRNLSGHRSLQRFRRSPSPRHLFHLQPLSLPRFGCCQISLKEASSRTANRKYNRRLQLSTPSQRVSPSNLS
jgi:hypothetical protein